MLVREVMSSPVYTVLPSTPIKQALQVLDSHSITAMPVVDEHGRPIGVVSEVDLLWGALRADQRRHEIPTTDNPDVPSVVAQVMNHHPVTVEPETDLATAVDLMMTTAIKSIPVVQHGRIIGIVSRRDVVHALARTDEEIRAEVGELLRAVADDWTVEVVDGQVEVDGPETDSQVRLATALASTVTGVVRVDIARAPTRNQRRRL
ncbi:MAG: CBS domain-containing protein [Nocardioidaceae bacterium]